MVYHPVRRLTCAHPLIEIRAQVYFFVVQEERAVGTVHVQGGRVPTASFMSNLIVHAPGGLAAVKSDGWIVSVLHQIPQAQRQVTLVEETVAEQPQFPGGRIGWHGRRGNPYGHGVGG